VFREIKIYYSHSSIYHTNRELKCFYILVLRFDNDIILKIFFKVKCGRGLSILNQNTSAPAFPFVRGVSALLQMPAPITAKFRHLENITAPLFTAEYNQNQVPTEAK
jgi:hypothetical protein